MEAGASKGANALKKFNAFKVNHLRFPPQAKKSYCQIR